MKDIVAHLMGWNRLLIARFQADEFFDHFHDDHEPDIRAWLARGERQ